VFDTLARMAQDDPWNARARVSPRCVRAYTLSVLRDDQWVEIAVEDANYRRVRRHTFSPRETSQVKLTVHAMHDERESARVYEIQVR
jgi:hypothetical protein